MIFNNLQRFNNTLTLMTKVFNKNHDAGLTISANDSALSGQIDTMPVSICQASGVRRQASGIGREGQWVRKRQKAKGKRPK
jgi:hypothetical protein